MKKFKIWSMMMLAFMALPMMIACGDDDGDNGTPTYTEAEIVEMLTGKWTIYGDFRLNNSDNGEKYEGAYTGTIEFKSDKKYTLKTSPWFQGGIVNSSTGETYKYDVDFSDILGTPRSYSVLKQGGKNYISFGSTNSPYIFLIVSLTKNSFRLVMDRYLNEEQTIHYYITIVSE